ILAGTLWLPVPKPPIFAQTSAAFDVARNFTNASIAGVSRNVTSRSPPISTAPALAPAVMDGKTAALKPVPGFDLVADVIAPPTAATLSADWNAAADNAPASPALCTVNGKLYALVFKAANKTSAYSLPLTEPSCCHAGA